MSQSGSSDYPLPLTGPTTTSLLSSSPLTVVQRVVEHQQRDINSSSKSVCSSSLKEIESKESLEIYSVHTHQRHKRKSPSNEINDKTFSNNNYDFNKVKNRNEKFK